MMGSLLTSALVMVLGYAYPAYECYKTVELNKPEIEQLRFWCQYWILVALLALFERVGDAFISWLPMYSEAKLAFYVYLWHPRTRGTTYVYDTFFRPYMSKHETEIDRHLLELRTRAGDIVVLYWHKVSTYGQSRFFEILQYIASQSSQPSRRRPAQRQQVQQPAASSAPALPRQPSSGAPARQSSSASQQLEQQTHVPPSATRSEQSEESIRSCPTTVPAATSQTQAASTSTSSSESTSSTGQGEGEAMQIDAGKMPGKEDSNPSKQETPAEDSVRLTRARLRKRGNETEPSH